MVRCRRRRSLPNRRSGRRPPASLGCSACARTPIKPLPFDEFARDRFIIGDKVSVREEIARYRELLGVDHFILRCQWPGLPQERVLHSIRRLGEIFAS
jgi:alkanesulfonate monooxygenase SsuD/methylene tetrahydromethanopterin reductase-like flavin-dependent oxidoreductase (luciferase family)